MWLEDAPAFVSALVASYSATHQFPVFFFKEKKWLTFYFLRESNRGTLVNSNDS
jgi:hypothetical protein